MVFIILPEVNKLRLRLRQNRSKLRLRPSGSGAQPYDVVFVQIFTLLSPTHHYFEYQYFQGVTASV